MYDQIWLKGDKKYQICVTNIRYGRGFLPRRLGSAVGWKSGAASSQHSFLLYSTNSCQDTCSYTILRSCCIAARKTSFISTRQVLANVRIPFAKEVTLNKLHNSQVQSCMIDTANTCVVSISTDKHWDLQVFQTHLLRGPMERDNFKSYYSIRACSI